MFLVQQILCTELIGVNEVASVKIIMGKFIIKVIILRQEDEYIFLSVHALLKSNFQYSRAV